MTDTFYERYVKYINEISSDKEYGFNKPLKEFIQSMTLLNPQSYGSRIERRIIKDSGNTKVPASEGRGDMVSGGGKYYEIKNSIITDTNRELNLVQIRLWQDVNYYLCIAYDIRDVNNFETYIFLLTHDQMVEQCEYHANAAHGTAFANEKNSKIEMRISVPIDKNNKVFKYWCENFSAPDFFSNNPYLKHSYSA